MFKWDPDKERHVSFKRFLYSEGHDITYSVAIRKLRAMKNWAFTKSYDTECKTYPTSFFLRMDFLEIREDSTVSLSVSLKRTDSQKLDLEACVWIQFCNFNDSLIYPKLTFSKVFMSAGEELKQTFELTPYPGMGDVSNRGLIFHVSIMTNFCHSDPEDSDSKSSESVYSEEY